MKKVEDILDEVGVKMLVRVAQGGFAPHDDPEHVATCDHGCTCLADTLGDLLEGLGVAF